MRNKMNLIGLEGLVWKDPNSSWWIAEVSILDLTTQGKTRKNSLEMIQDAVQELLKESYGSFCKVSTTLYEDGVFGLSYVNKKQLFGLALKRQRLSSGYSIRDVSKRLNAKSPNSYSRYERAQTNTSLEKYSELLHAVNPNRRPLLVS